MKFFINIIIVYIALVPFSLAFGYEFSEDSKPQDGVPKGKVTKHQFTNSKVYPGTVRDYWIYDPGVSSSLVIAALESEIAELKEKNVRLWL